MRPAHLLPLALVGSTALLGSGCTEAARFVPQVRFDRMDVQELTWEDVSTDFVFAVENPNPIEVGVAEFAYALQLEGVELASGDNADGFALEPQGVSELAIPVDLVFSEVWNTVQATRGEDEVGFRVAGRFGFDTPIGPVKLPYEEQGDFPALRTPRFRIDQLRVTQVAPSGATMELDLGVDNAHGSSLFFDDLLYGVRINGFKVADGLVQTFEAPGDTETELVLPVSVSFASIGNALAQAIASGGSVDVGFEAGVDVDTPFGILPLAVDTEQAVQMSPP